MFDTLLFVHLVVAVLLIAVILLQKTSSDGLSGIGGGSSGGNMGLVSGRTAANFLSKTTIILAVAFFINVLLLANLSTKKHGNIVGKLEQIDKKQKDDQSNNQDSLPMAK